MLKDHLEQLIKVGHLKEFVVNQGGVSVGQGLGIIEIFHATSMGVSVSHQKGILSVVTPPEADAIDQPKKRLSRTSVPIIFGEADLEGMS